MNKFQFAVIFFGVAVFGLLLLSGYRYSHRRPSFRAHNKRKARQVQHRRERAAEERFEESAIGTLEGEGGAFVAHAK